MLRKLQAFINTSDVHLQHQMARDDPKRRSVRTGGTGICGQANSEEKVRLDRSHPSEAGIQHYTLSPDLKSTGKMKTGWLRNGRRRGTEAELKQHNFNWAEAARTAPNKVRWQKVADGLCPIDVMGLSKNIGHQPKISS